VVDWKRHAAYERERSAYRVLVRKREERRLLGRSRRRQEDNITVGLKQVERERTHWIPLAQDRDKKRVPVIR